MKPIVEKLIGRVKELDAQLSNSVEEPELMRIKGEMLGLKFALSSIREFPNLNTAEEDHDDAEIIKNIAKDITNYRLAELNIF